MVVRKGIADGIVNGVTIDGKHGERLVLAAVQDEDSGAWHFGIFMLDKTGEAERVGVLYTKENYARVYEFFAPMAQPHESDIEEGWGTEE